MAENKEITLEDIMNKLLQVEGKIDMTNKNMNKQTEHINKLKETIKYQEKKIEKLENELRKKNIIIFGIPENIEEDITTLKEKVMEILKKKMEVQIQENEIDFINRIGERKRNVNRPTKVGITTILKKWEIMRNTRKLA